MDNSKAEPFKTFHFGSYQIYLSPAGRKFGKKSYESDLDERTTSENLPTLSH